VLLVPYRGGFRQGVAAQGDRDSAWDGPILAFLVRVFTEAYLPMSESPTLALADDDELHAELVSAWLEHQGYRVLRFPSGDDLLAWASGAAERADGLVLDIDMPGRDGIQSCRELRALDGYASVPAVFVSATSPRSRLEQAADTGSVQFIRKDGQMFLHLGEWLAENLYTTG
jgi:CheY-like chemotaxis protein